MFSPILAYMHFWVGEMHVGSYNISKTEGHLVVILLVGHPNSSFVSELMGLGCHEIVKGGACFV